VGLEGEALAFGGADPEAPIKIGWGRSYLVGALALYRGHKFSGVHAQPYSPSTTVECERHSDDPRLTCWQGC